MRNGGRGTGGFTLVELMIVVAVIAILAGLAIPNYLRFQCKSKQSEAKTNLSGLFTAEKSFFAEYNSYGTDLVNLGWQPDGSPLYIYGWSASSYPSAVAGTRNWNPANNNTMVGSVIGSPARYNTSKMKDLTGSPLSSASLPAVTTISGGSFVVGAAGDIEPNATVLLDQWSMNSSRALTVVLNDCSS